MAATETRPDPVEEARAALRAALGSAVRWTPAQLAALCVVTPLDRYEVTEYWRTAAPAWARELLNAGPGSTI